MTTVATKIELVTESIEALVIAQVIALSPGLSGDGKELVMNNVRDARDVLSRSLKELMTPTLRVIDGGGSPPKPHESIPYGGEGISGMDIG